METSGSEMILFIIVVLAIVLVFPIGTYLRRKFKRRLVSLSQPDESPEALINKLVHFFDAYNKVHTAYLAQAYDPEKYPEPYFIIGLVSEGDVGEAVEMLTPIVRDAVPSDRKVEFQSVGRDKVSKYLVNETTPIYLREETETLEV